MTVYYVTAIAIPRGATSLPGYRTDMGKFPIESDAQAHAALLRGPTTGFTDVKVEPRDEG